MRMFAALFMAALLVFAVTAGYSEEIMRTATVTQINGEVMVKDPGLHPWTKAKVGDVLNEGSFIKTGVRSTAVLGVDGGNTATVDVSEKSLISFAKLTKDRASGMKRTLLELSVGQVVIKAQRLDTPDSKFEVKTPTSLVGVRGTKFSVKVDALR
ncbi:MAG: FecR domain-containing protein [Candidatus Omnitrophica bacterium]|nr:FecR domain-containing protein [Candidatus Omnitrophota bacterium]